MEYITVFITAPNDQEASKIGTAIVTEGLVKCVNIISNIRSIYQWKGNIEDQSEVLIIAKTKKEKFAELCRRVKTLHSYEVPEVVAIPIVDGLPDYLNWLGSL
ncbi:MAG: divalent-cation tolerance protein CutA [Nitrospirae bacterium]|nr:divalent-cation tolerance protein CutA [Nitrospirota bacterium]